ncbi:DUF3072 domain-containing protein [Yoonia litorea]|uniref:DUF3072 domain-containing protein n=1 Tax=Yoonia litorea TaxID=1123755 RepID=A0A1I6MIW5_9RHOB|nr:DUF3072 domain-containing protein [Yoonia litorea]SFS15666.1 Protein of unknown function [Yoonia litorea]
MSTPTKPIQDPAEVITPNSAEATMTGDQADKLRALCEATGEPFDDTLSQAQAAKRIAALSEIAESN